MKHCLFVHFQYLRASRPREESSKKRYRRKAAHAGSGFGIGGPREAGFAPKPTFRDPRFDANVGEFDDAG